MGKEAWLNTQWHAHWHDIIILGPQKKGVKMPKRTNDSEPFPMTHSEKLNSVYAFRHCTLQPWLKVGISSRHALWMSGLVRSMILIFDGVLYTEHIPLPRFIRDTGNLKNLKNHCIYIRTVSLLSALLNWFKLVYGPFRQSNMHRTIHSISGQTSQEGIECNKAE